MKMARNQDKVDSNGIMAAHMKEIYLKINFMAKEPLLGKMAELIQEIG